MLTKVCDHHCNQPQDTLNHPPKPCIRSRSLPPPPPQPLATTSRLSPQRGLFDISCKRKLALHGDRVTRSVVFGDWLLSLNTMLSRLGHAVARVSPASLPAAAEDCTAWTNTLHFPIHQRVNIWVASTFLAITNNVATSELHVQIITFIN